MDFAYVTFVNDNETYLQLMSKTVESVQVFSKHHIIVYLKNVTDEQIAKHFPNKERLILRHVTTNLPSVYYYKPYVIIDSLEHDLESGYYIEADDVITPHADKLKETAKTLTNLPISPIHPDDVTPSQGFMNNLGVKKTQHYIHAHILFTKSNLLFLYQWFYGCMKSHQEHWDESVLNCMYWKYNCKDHYLPVIDPWYEKFYVPSTRENAVTYHGCKDPAVMTQLLQKMKEHYVEFKQTWWNDNVEKRLGEFKSWIGDQNAVTKLYTRKYIAQKGYKTMVDLGCADASIYRGMKADSYNIDYTGVDSCDFFIRKNNGENINTVKADVRAVPFPDNKFELVYSRHIIEHQPEFQSYMRETIRLASKEVIHIFFRRPRDDIEAINFDPVQQLYHNNYKRSDIEQYLKLHNKVESFEWKKHMTEQEDILHIYLKK